MNGRVGTENNFQNKVSKKQIFISWLVILLAMFFYVFYILGMSLNCTFDPIEGDYCQAMNSDIGIILYQLSFILMLIFIISLIVACVIGRTEKCLKIILWASIFKWSILIACITFFWSIISEVFHGVLLIGIDFILSLGLALITSWFAIKQVKKRMKAKEKNDRII